MPPPSLPALFLCFLRLGLQAWGGGLSAWMRREVVARRGWMRDGAFLSGLALAQVAPGANSVNLAVFIGTTLRGGPGALAALAGLMGAPAALVLAAGAVLLREGANATVDAALAGLGRRRSGWSWPTGCRSPATACAACASSASSRCSRWAWACWAGRWCRRCWWRSRPAWR